METASVQDREKQKKRPLSGPPFFKEAKWRESEETWFGAAPADRNGQSEMSRVKFFQGCDLFSVMGMSICGTKMVNGAMARPYFGNLFKIKVLG